MGFCNLVPGVIKIIDTPGNLLSIFIIVDQRYLGPFSGVDHIAVDRDWYLGLRVYFRNALAGQQHNIINIRVSYIKAVQRGILEGSLELKPREVNCVPICSAGLWDQGGPDIKCKSSP